MNKRAHTCTHLLYRPQAERRSSVVLIENKTCYVGQPSVGPAMEPKLFLNCFQQLALFRPAWCQFEEVPGNAANAVLQNRAASGDSRASWALDTMPRIESGLMARVFPAHIDEAEVREDMTKTADLLDDLVAGEGLEPAYRAVTDWLAFIERRVANATEAKPDSPTPVEETEWDIAGRISGTVDIQVPEVAA